MPNRTPRQQHLDELYPTVVRYVGIAVVVFYVIGRSVGLDVPDAILIAAAGMIGFKSVKGGGNGGVSNEIGKQGNG